MPQAHPRLSTEGAPGGVRSAYLAGVGLAAVPALPAGALSPPVDSILVSLVVVVEPDGVETVSDCLTLDSSPQPVSPKQVAALTTRAEARVRFIVIFPFRFE